MRTSEPSIPITQSNHTSNSEHTQYASDSYAYESAQQSIGKYCSKNNIDDIKYIFTLTNRLIEKNRKRLNNTVARIGNQPCLQRHCRANTGKKNGQKQAE